MSVPTSIAPPAATDDDTARRRRQVRLRLVAMAATALGAGLLYQFALVGAADWNYAMNLRARQLAALVVVGAGTGVATLMFQTVTQNRILTPSIMGFDALFRLIQTLFVWVFGSAILVGLDARLRFLVDASAMVVFGLLLYRWILSRATRDLFVLVLVGIVLGTLFSSVTLFASRLLSPDDYLTLQDLTFTSFNTVDTRLLTVTAVVTAVALAASIPLMRRLDVLTLGRDSAVTLGVDDRATVDRVLLIVTVLVACSTALVGPMTFIGLIVANLARRLLPTHRHRVLATGSALLGIFVAVTGQFIAARFLGFTTTLTVIVNLVGGLYFVWLLTRETDL